MKVNIIKVKELINERFDGKIVKFADEIDIDYSYLNQILNKHKSPSSKKMCDGIIEYCKKHNLDYNEYLFF